MDYIPIEIIKLLTLFLRPGIMVAVSKFFDIYDEPWYYNYLIMRYDRTEIVHRDFSYKELCQRSLLEGPIYQYDQCNKTEKNLKITGIKAIFMNNNYRILKFNGDLVILDINPIIIDNNVLDIDSYCYIKQSAIYIFKENKYICHEIIKPKLPILDIQYVLGTVWSFQFYSSDTIYFIDYAYIEIYKFKNKIIKAITLLEKIYITYILTDNNDLLIYQNKNFIVEPIIIHNVQDIGTNYICVNNEYYYNNGAINMDELIPLKYNISIPENFNLKKILYGKKIVWIDKYGTIMNTFEADDTIKNIICWEYNTYLIKN